MKKVIIFLIMVTSLVPLFSLAYSGDYGDLYQAYSPQAKQVDSPWWPYIIVLCLVTAGGIMFIHKGKAREYKVVIPFYVAVFTGLAFGITFTENFNSVVGLIVGISIAFIISLFSKSITITIISCLIALFSASHYFDKFSLSGNAIAFIIICVIGFFLMRLFNFLEEDDEDDMQIDYHDYRPINSSEISDE